MFFHSLRTISSINIFGAVAGDEAESILSLGYSSFNWFWEVDKTSKPLRLHFTKQFTVATKGVGTRGRPTSPLHLSVSDPEQILKEARKIKKS